VQGGCLHRDATPNQEKAHAIVQEQRSVMPTRPVERPRPFARPANTHGERRRATGQWPEEDCGELPRLRRCLLKPLKQTQAALDEILTGAGDGGWAKGRETDMYAKKTLLLLTACALWLSSVLVGSLANATLRHQTKGEKRMRLLISNLLATAMVLFGAMSASATTVNVTSDYAAGSIAGVGDLVNVTLTLDAPETGIQLLGINVAFDNTVLQYNARSNDSVGVPSYILYGGGMPSSALISQQDPWLPWPVPPAGQGQVNVNWLDATFIGTQVTGSGIKIAELQFQVIALGDGIGEVEVSTDLGGGILMVNGALAALGFTGTPVNVITPEPGTGLLVLTGLLGLAGSRRR